MNIIKTTLMVLGPPLVGMALVLTAIIALEKEETNCLVQVVNAGVSSEEAKEVCK